MSTTAVLLIGVLWLLALIFAALVALIRKDTTPTLDLTLSAQFDEAIERLGRAVQHHADVSAVVEMVRQLDADPDALELLKSYPETVRAAAWLHYINTLGADLQHAQKSLSNAHTGRTQYYNQQGGIDARQKDVDAIRAKLDAAIKASGQAAGPRPI